jgi:hypothetical protein
MVLGFAENSAADQAAPAALTTLDAPANAGIATRNALAGKQENRGPPATA